MIEICSAFATISVVPPFRIELKINMSGQYQYQYEAYCRGSTPKKNNNYFPPGSDLKARKRTKIYILKSYKMGQPKLYLCVYLAVDIFGADLC